MKNQKLSYKAAALYALFIYIMITLIVGVLAYFGRAAFMPTHPPADEIPRPNWEDSSMIMPIMGFVASYIFLFVLFSLNFKILESNIKGMWKNITAILLTLIAAFVLNNITFYLQSVLWGIEVSDMRMHMHMRIGSMAKDFVLAAIVIFSSQIAYLSSKKQQMALEYETMKAENARSRFKSLKNQLDPHFLFNTFNTLDSLIQEDTKKAQDYLHQLSSVFRYVMPNKELTTLEDELEFTHSYSSLMQLRYEDNLVFDSDIDKNMLRYEIVPLSIQTLVENAIKHNVISAEQPFVIRIATGSNNTITVSNPLQPKKTPESGSGIGLSNLNERFRLKFQKDILISNSDNTFAVTLPLKAPKNENT